MLLAALTRFRLLAVPLLGLIAWACYRHHYLPAIALAVLLLVIIVAGVFNPRLKLFGPYVCRGATARRWVALTFDDGPDPEVTPSLLDLLREEGVPAAFFCVGHRVDAHPELAARMVREGHQVENHSYAHSHATNVFTVSRLRADLGRTQESILRATGVRPTCFRPPMGLSNPRIFRAARSLGLAVIGWTARGLDTVQPQSERVVGRIVRRLRPGAIILLHDRGIPRERLLRTVKTLLDRLRTLEYEVVRLDQLLS